MLRTLICTGLVITVSGCGGLNSAGSLGSANPIGWFKPKDQTIDVPLVRRDPRALVPEITSLRAEPTNGGIIVKATGQVPYDGYHTLSLVPTNSGFPDKEGNLVFEMRGFLPPVPPTLQRSQTVTVAQYLSNKSLRNVTAIKIQAQSNSRTLRP